jgi:predicted DCC family thiol-disulfide oxidoreductase YuxK
VLLSVCENHLHSVNKGSINGNTLPNPYAVTIWWDSSCPLCTKEIEIMKKLDKHRNVQFIDVITSSTELLAIKSGCPIDKKELLARIHAKERDKEVVTGAAAFAALWKHIPHLRWLGLLAQNQRVLSFLEAAYVKFLVYRPKLQKIFVFIFR